MADTTEEAAEPFVPQAVPDLVIPQLLANDDEENFEGKYYHTGDWPKKGVSFAGKNVGQIGTGTTGIQAVPVIAKEAKY